jgi:hypothetical protein
MNAEAAHLISRFGLGPLPREGGFFASTWTSAQKDSGGRALGSAILFLITEEDFSALHRLGTDEVWHFNAGDPAELAVLDPTGGTTRVCVLGPDVAASHVPQAVVRAGVWQGARLVPGGSRGWALFSCTLSPAWDEAEFELGRRADLLFAFPERAAVIAALTR